MAWPFVKLCSVAFCNVLLLAGCGSMDTPDMQDARTLRYDAASAMRPLTVCVANAGHYLADQKPDGPITKKMMKDTALRITPIRDRSNRGVGPNDVPADAAPYLYLPFSTSGFFELADLELDPEISGLQVGRGVRIPDRYPTALVLTGSISGAERVSTASATGILNLGTVIVSLGASRAYNVSDWTHGS